MSAALFVVACLAGLVLLSVSCLGWGRLLLRRLPADESLEADERVLVSTSAGLAWLAFAGLGLGLVGWLYRAAVWGLLLSGATLSLTFLARLRLRALRSAHAAELAVLLLALVPGLALCLYPPSAFDATLYHLPTARAFAEAHSLVLVTDVRFPVFPHLNEVLFAMALLVAGDIATHLVHFLELLLCTLGVFVLGRRLGSVRAGLWAAALWVGNPLAIFQGASATVDVALTLFVVLAVLAAEEWRRVERTGWLLLSAVFAGLAAATKYLGLVPLAALAALSLLQGGPRRGLRSGALFLAAALGVLAPWYARIAALTGNPLFPFLTAVFGPNAWQVTGDWRVEGSGLGLSLTAIAQKLVSALGDRTLLLLPWSVAFDRDAFHYQPPLSPYYLVLLPVLVMATRRSPAVGRLLLVSGAYLLAWMALPRYLHYLLPVAALLAPAFGCGLDRLVSVAPVQLAFVRSRAATALVMVALVASSAVYAVHHLRRRGVPPSTDVARQAYLEEQLPGYAAIRMLNERYGRRYTVYGLWAENLHYYAAGRFLGDWFGPASFPTVTPFLGEPRALYRRLRELGVDFLLIRRLRREERPAEQSLSEPLFEPLLEGGSFILYRLAPVDRPKTGSDARSGFRFHPRRPLWNPTEQPPDTMALGAERGDQRLDRAFGVAVPAEEDIEGGEAMLGPGVHRDVRLCEVDGGGDAMRREAMDGELEQRRARYAHRGAQGLLDGRRVIEDVWGCFPGVDDEVNSERVSRRRFHTASVPFVCELGKRPLRSDDGGRHDPAGEGVGHTTFLRDRVERTGAPTVPST